jgi:hypothetical protein
MSVLVGLVSVLFLMGPVLVLVAIGIWSLRSRPDEWRIAGVAAAVGVGVWAAFTALYEHETPCDGGARCPSIFGSAAPLSSEEGSGYLLLFGGMLIAAAVIGAVTKAPSIAIGASLVALPTVLAWWMAPRGDNDGLWVFIFWALAVLGGFAAGSAETARSIATTVRQRRGSPGRSTRS